MNLRHARPLLCPGLVVLLTGCVSDRTMERWAGSSSEDAPETAADQVSNVHEGGDTVGYVEVWIAHPEDASEFGTGELVEFRGVVSGDYEARALFVGWQRDDGDDWVTLDTATPDAEGTVVWTSSFGDGWYEFRLVAAECDGCEPWATDSVSVGFFDDGDGDGDGDDI